jgi:hypothetical protein
MDTWLSFVACCYNCGSGKPQYKYSYYCTLERHIFDGKNTDFRRQKPLYKLLHNCDAPLQQKFAAVARITCQATIKFIKTPKTDICSLNGRGPIKLKKNVHRENGKSLAIDWYHFGPMLVPLKNKINNLSNNRICNFHDIVLPAVLRNRSRWRGNFLLEQEPKLEQVYKFK